MANKHSPLPKGAFDGALDLIDPAVQISQRTSMAMATGVDPFSRKIYLVGDICDAILGMFLPAFQILDSTDGAIQIVLSSPGGSEPAGWAIYDAIRLARNPVIIDGYGSVFSIAALIFQAGLYRRLAPNCRFMIHNGSVLIDGGIGANEAVGMGEEVKKNNHRYAKAIQDRSNLTFREVEDLCRAETFLSAEETIKMGFADGMIPFQTKQVKNKRKKK
jgi:ATP-dependent protease ClpP protease subunit